MGIECIKINYIIQQTNTEYKKIHCIYIILNLGARY